MAETTKIDDGELIASATVADEAEDTAEAAAVDSEAEEKDASSPFYKEVSDPRLFITRFKQKPRRRQMNQRISMYVERAKRLLRGHETIRVHGIEEGMATACSVVEILRREGIAVVNSMQTNLNVQSSPKSRHPFANGTYLSMDFVLGRGELSAYVTDRKQRKLVALFEQKDPERTGKISKADAVALDMGDAFYSTEEEQAAAAAFADTLGDEISMPDFIKYASYFINHNLRLPVFFDRCAEVYGLTSRPRGRGRGRRGKGRKGDAAAATEDSPTAVSGE